VGKYITSLEKFHLSFGLEVVDYFVQQLELSELKCWSNGFALGSLITYSAFLGLYQNTVVCFTKCLCICHGKLFIITADAFPCNISFLMNLLFVGIIKITVF